MRRRRFLMLPDGRARPNQRLHLTPLVGVVAEWTVGTVQETGLLFQVPSWVLVSGFQKEKYVSGAGEPRPLGFPRMEGI